MDESSLRAADEAVAAEVRAAMGRRRVTQTLLAREIEVSQPYIQRRLSARTSFSIADLAAIAEVLDVTIGSLAGAADKI